MNYALMYFFFGGGGLLFSVSPFSEYNPRNELQLNEDVLGDKATGAHICGQSDRHRSGQYIYGNQSEGRVDWNLRYIRGLSEEHFKGRLQVQVG